uniref:ATP-dependent RNA helicase DHX58-like isoform X1 n=1 Tax=Myxine glutinosa TaxID=7769 RepID=UPI00358EA409
MDNSSPEPVTSPDLIASESAPSSSQQLYYLLECFRPRLRDLVQPRPMMCRMNGPTLSRQDKQEIEAKCDVQIAAADLLLDKVETAAREGKQGCLAELLTALQLTGQETAAGMLDASRGPLSIEIEQEVDMQVQLIELMTPEIMSTIKVDETCLYINEGKRLLLPEEEQQIQQTKREHGDIRAVRHLLAVLVTKPVGWFDSFISALKKTNHNELVKTITGSDDYYPSLSKVSNMQQSLVMPLADKPLEEQVSTNVDPPPLRDYQLEVAQPALQGKNTIICLPTGTGKTRVAAFITQRHLSAATLKKGKVVVLVNKVALVEQHYREFHNFLKPQFKVTRVSGEAHHKGNLGIGLQNNDVIICTAQILENALVGGDQDDNMSRITLNDFSLLIFDECHHTTKDDVYNKIMARYLECKHDGEKHLPQILGLTASPGVGGANGLYKAQSHILKICANLDANEIKTVQNSIEDLERHTKEPKCSSHIAEERTEDRFGGILKEMMTEIHNYIAEDVKHKFGTQPYEEWIVSLERKAALNKDCKRHVCAVHLRKYNDALLTNYKLRMADALTILLDFYDEEYSNFSNGDGKDTVQKFLIDLFNGHKDDLEKVASDPRFENSCLNKLQQAIVDNFAKNTSSQGIVFTQTRKSAFALGDWIGQNKDLQSHKVKAHYLVGSGNGKNHKQMTANEQKEVIEKFRIGTINLLISTSVGEEGLDLKACNFVICYRMVTNEIAMVQKRGRARADGSSYILVACEDEDISDRETTNIYRENMMAKAIKQVQLLPPEEYLKQIHAIQEESICQRKLLKNSKRKKTVKHKDQTIPPQDVVFLCRNCHSKSCHGSDIRVAEGMHHMNINEDFQFVRKPTRQQTAQGNQDYDEECKNGGPICCPKCRTVWGSQMFYKGMELPCLSVESFVLEIKVGSDVKTKVCSKWTEIPFIVPALSLLELLKRRQN